MNDVGRAVRRSRSEFERLGLVKRQPIAEDGNMRVVADISVIPLGVGVSLSPYIAECERVLLGAGLNPQLHAYGTNVEGEWSQVFEALRACHEAVHRMGAPRVSTNVRLGTRTDRPESLESRLESVLGLVGDASSPRSNG